MTDTKKPCPRCAAYVPSSLETLDDGPQPIEYCPFCGYEFEDGMPSLDTALKYIEDDAPETDIEELAAIVRQTTAARGVDVYAVEVRGLEPVEWARMTGRDRSTVSRNVRRATDDE